MIKRSLIFFLVTIMVILTACGSPTTADKTSENKTNGKSEGGSVDDSSEDKISEEVADPFGKYEETVVINIGKGVDATEKLPDGDTPEDNQYTRYIKDNLNIEVKFQWQAASGNDYNQKVNLSIASNDLPDAMVVNNTQFRQAVRAGQLQDLTDAYNVYASPVMREMMDKTEGLAMDAVTFDEKMLALPNVPVPDDGYQLMWIRKDWLDKLGLEVPMTIDEIEEVATAFVERDPDGNNQDDTIGILGPQTGGVLYANFLASTNATFGLDPIFAAYKSFPGYWLETEDGGTVYGSILPETKQALAKLREWYEKGIIDKEIGVRKDSAEIVASGKAGIFFGPWWLGYWPLPDAVSNNPEANWQAYTSPLDMNGEYNSHMGVVATEFLIVRKDYDHPEAVIKMNNLLLRDENKFDLSKGGIGNYPLRVPMAAPDESEVTINALMDVLKGNKNPEDFDDPSYDMYKLLRDDVDNVRDVKLEPYDNTDIQYWNTEAREGAWKRLYSLLVGAAPIYRTDINRVYSRIYYQTKTIESRWANLKKLEDETFMKIIMGSAPLDEFDNFVEEWKKQGGDIITTEVDEAVKK